MFIMCLLCSWIVPRYCLGIGGAPYISHKLWLKNIFSFLTSYLKQIAVALYIIPENCLSKFVKITIKLYLQAFQQNF